MCATPIAPLGLRDMGVPALRVWISVLIDWDFQPIGRDSYLEKIPHDDFVFLVLVGMI